MEEITLVFKPLSKEEGVTKQHASTCALTLINNERCHTHRSYKIAKYIFKEMVNSDIEFNLGNLYAAASIMLLEINNREVIKLKQFDYDVIYCLLYYFYESTTIGTSNPLFPPYPNGFS